MPLSIANTSNQLGGFTASQRPNQVGVAALDRGDRTLDWWSNTAAFGTAPRLPLHRPRINNWDLSLRRNFQLAERFPRPFRAAFYNALNHAQYNAPGNTLNTTRFGRITSGRDPHVTELALRIFF